MSSNNVDERVVKMTFDNDQFEAGVKQTLTSLEELKQSLKFNNSLTGIQAVSSAFNSFSLANITSQLDTLTNRFSTLGIVGMTAIENITNKVLNFASSKVTSTLGQITSGGWARASSIAQSRFTLQGLLNDEEKVQEAFDSASNAVDGTAYSLNSAVAAASQLAASGIDVGEEMENTLKGIAGTAAMTGDSFDSIANIFTTVAGNGRLMGMQLTQLSAHGLNAAATIAEYLGTTEAEVREMTSKGQISFETFSNAMQSAFGEHAKDANKTFSGSMDNIKSALSRIGAIFSSGIIENDDLINALNQIRITINSIKTAMLPLESKFKNLVSAVSNAFSGVLGEFNVKPFEVFIDVVGRAMDTVSGLINRWSRAKGYLKESLFGEEADEKIEATAEQLERANEAVQKANDIWEKAAYGVGEARKELLGDDYDLIQSLVNQRAAGVTDLTDLAVESVVKSDEALKQQNNTIAQGNQELEETQNKIIPIARVINGLTTFGDGFRTIFNNIKITLAKIGSSFKKIFSWKDLIDDIKDYGNMFSEFMGYFTLTEERSDKLERALTGLWSTFDLLRMIIKAVAGGLSKTLGPVLSVIFDVFLTITATVGDMITKFREWYRENDLLKSILSTLGTIVQTVVKYVTTFFEKLNQLPAVQKIRDAIKELADVIGEKLFGYLGDAQSAIEDFFGSMDEAEDNPKMQKVLDHINDALENIITFSGDAKQKFTDFTNWVSKKGEELYGTSEDAETLGKKIEGIKKAGKSLIDGEGFTAFFSNLSGVFGDFTGSVDRFISWIIEKFNSLDAAKVALVGFGTSITAMGLSFSYLSWNLAGFIKAFTDIPLQISGTIKSVKGIFKSMSEYIKNDSQAKLIKAYAIAIAVLALSLIALTLVDQDKLQNATTSLALLMGIMLATVGVVALVASKTKDFAGTNATLRSMSIVFIAVATAAFILAEALSILGDMDYTSDKWWAPLVVLAGIMAALVVVSIAVSKWAGKLSAGALTIVAMGAAVWLIAKAMQALNNVETNGLEAKIDALIKVLGALTLCFVVINLLARGHGVMSAFAVLEMIAAIMLIELALYGIMYFGVSMDDLKDHLDRFYPVLIALGIVAVAVSMIGIFSKQAIKMTGTILAFAVATLLMVLAIKALSDISKSGDLAVGLIALTGIFVLLLGLLYILDKVSSVAQGIGKELIAISIAVGLLALITYALSHIKDYDAFRMGVLACLACIALVGALAAVTRVAKNVDYKSLYAMVVALGVVTVAVTLMSMIKDKTALLEATGILGLALISLGSMMYMAGQWADQINVKSILLMILSVSMITSSLYLLMDKAGGDYKTMLSASLAITTVLLAVAAMFLVLGKVFEKNNGVSIEKRRLQMIAEVIVMVGVIAMAIAALSFVVGIAGNEALQASVIAVLSVMAAIAVAVAALSTKGLKFDKSLSSMMILMIVTIAVIAAALAGLTYVIGKSSTDALYAAVVGIGLVLVSIGITLALISKLASQMSVASVVAFGLAIGVLAAVAGSLWLVLGTGADWQTMLAAAGAMVAVLVSVAAAIGVLAAIGQSGVGLGVILVVAVALSGTMIALGFSMKLAASAMLVLVQAVKDLATIDFTPITENLGTLWQLVLIFAAVSTTSFILGAGLVVVGAGLAAVGLGAGVIVASMLALAAGIIVVMTAATSFINALNGLINTFKTSKGEIQSGISEIGTGLANAITNFTQTLADNSETIASNISTILINVLAAFISFKNQALETIAQGILDFLDVVDTYGPQIATKATDTLMDILASLAQNSGKIAILGAYLVASFVVGVFQGLSVKIGSILQAAWGFAISFIYGIADTVYENTAPLIDAMKYLGLVLVRELIAAFNIGGIFDSALEEIDGEIEYQKSLREEEGAEAKEAFNAGVESAGDAEIGEIDTSKAKDSAAKDGTESGELFSGNMADEIKSKISEYTGGASADFGLDSVTSMFGQAGTDSGTAFGTNLDTSIQEHKVDASGIPDSIKEQLKGEGYEYDETGKYLVKKVETSINDNSSDLDLSDTSDAILNNLVDEGDTTAKGEEGLEWFVSGWENLDDTQQSRLYAVGEKIGNKVYEGAAASVEVESPSKKAMYLRDMFVEGLTMIGSDLETKVFSAYAGVGNNAVTAVADSMASISNVLQDDSMDWTPTLTPVIDSSQLQNGSNLLTATFGNSALSMAADTALSVKDTESSNLAAQVAALSEQVKKLADTDYSELLKGVNINVNAETNVDGTRLRKMASSYTIEQIDTQQSNYNMSRGARA